MSGWAFASALRIHPHYLSYFNEIVGGPNKGHEYLLDSNIDWGQDLLFLKGWLDEHPEARPFGLACWNLVDPTIEGIRYHLPPFGPTGLLPGDQAFLTTEGPKPGYYGVSVNLLHGLDFTVPDGQGNFKRVPQYAYTYFQQFRPVAKAGYSIFIYHITLDEANAVRQKLGLPPLTEETAKDEKSHGH